ncbi:MAG: hypothetical protein F6K19_31700 [Cyanothece sp. SIO1E1]|nr:hypothetical protein [Cyanothece sp. SIO1E1]
MIAPAFVRSAIQGKVDFLLLSGLTQLTQASRPTEGAEEQAVFQTALDFTLEHEGTLADDEDDPGGRTMKGVTQKVYTQWRVDQGLKARDVADISDRELTQIYFTRYWREAQCYQYLPVLAITCFDTVVNFGVSGGMSFFYDLPDDSIRAALLVVERRMAYRYERVAENGTQVKFKDGWLDRDASLKALIETFKP